MARVCLWRSIGRAARRGMHGPSLDALALASIVHAAAKVLRGPPPAASSPSTSPGSAVSRFDEAFVPASLLLFGTRASFQLLEPRQLAATGRDVKKGPCALAVSRRGATKV